MGNPWDKFDDWLTTPPNKEIDEETISDRIKYYMEEGQIWYPFDWSNFTEIIYSANTKEADEIMDWAKNKNYKALGLYLYCMVMEKCEKEAENLAMEDYNAGLIGDDRD